MPNSWINLKNEQKIVRIQIKPKKLGFQYLLFVLFVNSYLSPDNFFGEKQSGFNWKSNHLIHIKKK